MVEDYVGRSWAGSKRFTCRQGIGSADFGSSAVPGVLRGLVEMIAEIFRLLLCPLPRHAYVLAFLIIFVIVVVMSVRQEAGSTDPNGVRSYSNLTRNHTEAPINYPQNPPVGGETTTPSGKTAASTPSRSGTRTPYTPWSTGRCGSPTVPPSRRIR